MITKTPVWGVDYDVGYIGFSFSDNSFISKGIVWFTRKAGVKDAKVSHTFIVKDERSVVEADFGGVVVKEDLLERFDRDHLHVFFRKPRGWTPERGRLTVEAALQHKGDHYNYALIFVHAFCGSFLGRFINKITFNRAEYLMSWSLSKLGEICSQLVAIALRAVYGIVGVLKQTVAAITPRELAIDDDVFVPMKLEE